MILIRLVFVLFSLALLFGTAAYAKTDPMPGGKHNSHTPIDVTSDTLEVMQDQNQAIFSGHVVAIQGEVRLKADKMTVHYAKKDADSTDKKTKAAKSPVGDSPDAGAIKKIDAEGSVFLSTPEETASGSSGTYDVEHQEIHLNDHVVLTRGKNVLKGDALTYNFATGKSKLTSAANASSDGKSGRVHALFVPENKDGEDSQ